MYNHYIPQSDGSYRRNPQLDGRRPPPPKPRPEPPKECPPEPPKPLPCPPQQNQGSVLEFFRGLLPKGLDTADLMIVFLLLLMNRDDEGGISPVLTLALYFLL
jgi:hypothetical protein